jgi:putative transposase
MDLPPKIVMRDNDQKFLDGFDLVVEATGAMIKRNAPWSPNLRAHVERFIQTLKIVAC